MWELRVDGTDVPAILYAYDATNLTNLLYSSDQNSARDNAGRGLNFITPIVANGKVYVATTSQVTVYGVLASSNDLPPQAVLSVTPNSGGTPLTVTASTAASSDPDGIIASSWIDFGDGMRINKTAAQHTYTTPGTYTVIATVYDNAGVSSRATATVKVLNDQPPFGWIDGAVNASDGSTTISQNGTLRASGWAADQEDGAPVNRVEVRIDGSAVGNATLGISRPDVASSFNDPRYTSSGWSFSYNIGTLATGTHTVTAVAFDSAGVSTVLRGVKTITVSIANTAPFGWIDGAVNAGNGSTTIPQNGTLAASGWAADQEDGAPVSRVQVRIDGVAVGNATLGFSRPDVASAYGDNRYTNSGWRFSYNVASLALGTHTVTAVALDSAGVSTVLRGAKTITVAPAANTAPFGWIDGAVNASNGSTTIPQNGTLAASGWAADQQDGAPVARVQILVDGAAVGNAILGISRPDVASAYGDTRYTNSGWKFSFNIGNLALGTHTITAVGIDSAGLAATLRGSKSITVTQ